MVALRALLVGDIATLQVATWSSSSGHRGDDDEVEGRREDLGYILKRSFGKFSEVHSHSHHGVEPPASSQQPTAVTNSGLRCLQLSLEEAFYLAHVDKCLALAVRPLFFSTAGATALPTPPRRKRRLGDEHPHLPHNHPGDHQGGADAAAFVTTARGQDFAAAVGFIGGGASGCEDVEALDGDSAPVLTSEEAWQYCCDRRPDFPAMFAVYRHFRVRRYTVHTGHKYGAHFVLYEGPPDECHSRYCVLVTNGSGGDSWGHMKTVTRLMPDVAKCLLVCGVSYRYRPPPQRSSPEQPPSSLPLDTASLAALKGAEVTALRFSRSRESDGDGGKSATSTLKVRQAARSTSCVEKPAKRTGKKALA
eukprot:g9241.t1